MRPCPGAGSGVGPADATSTIHTGLDRSGHRRTSPPRRTRARSTRSRPGSALLVVKRGPNAGSRFLLDQDVTTAGRHPDSDIFLDDVTVSRRHAEFRREGSGYTVHDVGSLNGTYVNRERIDAAPLSGGDEVQIGKFRLVYLTAAVRTGAGAPGHRRDSRPPRNGRSGHPATLTIGDVLAHLKAEFPTSRSARSGSWRTRGWSSRERTPSGYRKFSAADVARLRYVLGQQRDHYLPLRVIKDQLDAIDRGLVAAERRRQPARPHVAHRRDRGQRADRRALPPGAGRDAAVEGGAAQRRRPARRAAAASSSSSA